MIIHSFTIYVFRHKIVILNCLLSGSHEIAHSIRSNDGFVHLRNPVYSTTMKMNRAKLYPLITGSKWVQPYMFFINEEDIKDLTFHSINITHISCWMRKYTFGNTRACNVSTVFSLTKKGYWKCEELAIFSFEWSLFSFENWKTTLKKLI